MIQKGLGDDAMSATQIKGGLLKVIHVLEGLQQAEHLSRLKSMDCNQQRSVTHTARTGSWSGDSKNYCVWDFNPRSWHEICCGKTLSTASATEAEGTLCCSCWWLDSNSYQWARFPPEGHNFEGDWSIIVYIQCFLYLISSSINVSIFILPGWIVSGQTFKQVYLLNIFWHQGSGIQNRNKTPVHTY